MNISGSGRVSAGEHNEKISISGSGKIDGNIRCIALHCSGSVKGEGNIVCAEDVRVSGSAHFDKSVSADIISVSGSVKVGGGVNAKTAIKISGSFGCGESLRAALLSCSGSVDIGGEAEADEIRISGRINCAGLLNAEKVSIRMDGFNVNSKIGSIGGSEIKIHNDRKGEKISRMPLLSKLVGSGGKVIVDELVEGDIVAVECVKAPRVVGRVVAIGADCEIDLVQYSEEIEVHPKATVKKVEKI